MPTPSSPDVPCRLVLVRHIVKCAGTTMRGVWERLALTTLDWHTQTVFPATMHHCFYGAMKRRREALVNFERCAAGDPSAIGAVARAQAAIEYHVSTDGSTSFARDLRAIRSLPRAPARARAVAIALVREPSSWFASVYRYQLLYRRNMVDMPAYVARARSPQLGHLLGGSGFLLNTSETWRRHTRGMPEMHPYEGRFVLADYPTADAALGALDVLGTMRQFSEAVFLTCRLLGLPACPHFARQWESTGAAAARSGGLRELPPGPWPLVAAADVARIRALIEEHAGGDRWLYARAAARLGADVDALGPADAAALSAYVRAQAALTEARALPGDAPCRALRAWNESVPTGVGAGRRCGMTLTPDGVAAAAARGWAPRPRIWVSE
jgi:hypothetical protein